MFLLSSSRLQDPNFFRTVILLVRHDEEGAVGLVLNRPLQTSVSEAVSEAGVECTSAAVLHQGGPCEGPMMALHTDPSLSDLSVGQGLHVSTARHHIEALLRNPHDDSRYFVGYAGWGPGQLEDELQSNSWLVRPSDVAEIFNPPAIDEQWTRLMKSITARQSTIRPNLIPDDPSLN